ncbi:MAG: lipoyl synthase [Proteobacteria bacterium]|nr:lipoyl synthase [Pseudomonadota bacterium]
MKKAAMGSKTPAKPPWLKVRLPGSTRYHELKRRSRQLGLSTVCEEARCPNIGECWGQGTSTFMIMGDICTRGCRFCAVKTRRHGQPLDPAEPQHLAQAIAEMDLDYAVITSVDRDDLDDGGAAHFASCIEAIRLKSPKTKIEVLIPDFLGHEEHLRLVVNAHPEVIGHNIETVKRLSPGIRDPRASYSLSLEVLSTIRRLNHAQRTKSSLMVGLGESEAEVRASLLDLRAVGVDLVAIGQYLQPSKRHLEVVKYVSPEQFEVYRQMGMEIGFKYVASAPLVRSSYKASEGFAS